MHVITNLYPVDPMRYRNSSVFIYVIYQCNDRQVALMIRFTIVVSVVEGEKLIILNLIAMLAAADIRAFWYDIASATGAIRFGKCAGRQASSVDPR